MQNARSSGSKNERSLEVHTSNNKNSDSENKDIPLKASDKRELRHPVKPIRQNESTLGTRIMSNEDSEEENYHRSKKG